ncbi:MAG: alpha/beta hydrolase [Planctomycetota bacterium]
MDRCTIGLTPISLLSTLLTCIACSSHLSKIPLGDIYHTHVFESDQPLVAESGYQLWLPDEIETVRCIIFINQRGAGKHLFYQDQRWRQLAADLDAAILFGEFEAYSVRGNGYGQSILKACEQFAVQLVRPELRHTPFVLWGHSMGGRVAQDFARFIPNRVVAFVIAMRAHPSEPAMMEEEDAAMQIPALYIMGADDNKPKDIYAHYEHARKNGSPRAWVWVPKQKHWPAGMGHEGNQTTESDWNKWSANDLVLPWIDAVVQLRMPVDAEKMDQPIRLRPIQTSKGWLGHLCTNEIMIYRNDDANDPAWSWFPTWQIAECWIEISRE